MKIIVPVDIKYKGVLHKAHTPFFCDSLSYEELFRPLGAWAFQDDIDLETTPTKEVEPKKTKGKK